MGPPLLTGSKPLVKCLDDAGLDLIFRSARSHNGWQNRPVDDATLRAIYDLAKLGATSSNACPGRFVFIRSPAAKARLKPHLVGANADKTMEAPCCVIVAYDTAFPEFMPQLFPARGADLRSMFESNPAMLTATAERNSSLQGAYFMIAARALGLDCGPMSGFNRAGVDAEFFADGRWKANFLCNLGYGNHTVLFPRNPRLHFEQACREL
jgi:3-hydroxypropanoate dehydrogenase